MYLVGQRRVSVRGSGSDLQRQESYTLIEILITIAIISIMAAIAIPNFLLAQIRSKVASAVTNQSMIAAALDSYYVDYEQYPFNNLLAEAEVLGSEVIWATGAAPRRSIFAAPQFEMVEPQPPEPIFLDIGETTGPLETISMMPMSPETFEPYQSVVTTTRTVVREIPYSSEVPITTYPWQFCSSCGTVNAQTMTNCAECRHSLGPSDRYMIYNQSLNGDVLSVLTTPVAYLPSEVNKDVFYHRWMGRAAVRPQAFSYVNYLQINPDGVAIPLIGRRVHYAIISYGPDISLNYIHSYPAPQISIYDPTNGTISPGDIINFGQ